MAELKPCPFCGRKAKYNSDRRYAYVSCSHIFCNAVGPRVAFSDRYIAKDLAIAAWNRRASDG